MHSCPTCGSPRACLLASETALPTQHRLAKRCQRRGLRRKKTVGEVNVVGVVGAVGLQGARGGACGSKQFCWLRWLRCSHIGKQMEACKAVRKVQFEWLGMWWNTIPSRLFSACPYLKGSWWHQGATNATVVPQSATVGRLECSWGDAQYCRREASQ